MTAPGPRFILECALYTTSIIVGAGILGLPTLTATIGLVPGIGLTVILGVALMFIYMRIASSIHAALRARITAAHTSGRAVLDRAGLPPDAMEDLSQTLGTYVIDRKGVGIMDSTCAWLGLGHAGRSALLVGLTIYVIPAMVLYLTSGGLALAAIAGHLDAASLPAGIVGATAFATMLLSTALPYLPGNAHVATLRAFLRMVAAWIGGIAILMVAPGWEPLPVLLFTAAVTGLVLATRTASPQAAAVARDARRPVLQTVHRVGAMIAVLNLALLVLAGSVALIVLARNDALASPVVVPPGVEPRDLATASGGLLFAFTGTGIFNLIRYPALFGKGTPGDSGLRSAVMAGTLIATIAYAGWMLAIALCLDPAVLILADDERRYATVPLADLLGGYGVAGWIVLIAGYLVALLAVTSAGIGMSESLADRIARTRQARSGMPALADDAPDPVRVRRVHLGIIGLTAMLALALQAAGEGVAYRDILAVAGYAGGGLLLLVLPFFIPTRGRRRAPRRDLVLASAIAGLLAGLNLLEMPPDAGQTLSGTVTGGMVLAITFLFLASVAWLLLGATRSRMAPG